MKIAHISDTHGYFPSIADDIDLVVHSGDFLPDPPIPMTPKNRIDFQQNWLLSRLPTIKDWVHNKTLVMCQGNHDWLPPILQESILQKKINAYVLHEKVASIKNLYFYGFPFVPTINGFHNHEKSPEDMSFSINKITNIVNKSKIDVLISHAPPAGIFDLAFSGERFGNPQLSNAIINDFKIFPKAFLFGHIHFSGGQQALIKNSIFSNAATKVNYIYL